MYAHTVGRATILRMLLSVNMKVFIASSISSSLPPIDTVTERANSSVSTTFTYHVYLDGFGV